MHVVTGNLDLDLHPSLGQDLALGLDENQGQRVLTTSLSWKLSPLTTGSLLARSFLHKQGERQPSLPDVKLEFCVSPLCVCVCERE